MEVQAKVDSNHPDAGRGRPGSHVQEDPEQEERIEAREAELEHIEGAG